MLAKNRNLRTKVCCLLLCLFAFLLLTGCTKLFFFPYKTLAGTPSDLGYRYSDIWLTASDDTRLHAWLIPPEKKSRGFVLFLHGNAENVSTHIRSVLWLVVQGYTVLALDYRGFGLSAGEPDVPEVFDDINTAFNWLSDYKVAVQAEAPLYLFGQSLGASLSIKYLDLFPKARAQVAGLISEAGFTRYGAIGRHVAAGSWVTWAFQYPVQWLLPSEYDPLDAVQRLSPTAMLFIHSKADEIIPFFHAEQLLEKSGKGGELLVANGPHINAVRDPDTRLSILDFMERHK